MKLYGIFGSGGFGREVMPVAREMLTANYGTEGYELVFVVEDLKQRQIVNGHKVISKLDFYSYQADKKYFNIAIADYRSRERLANEMFAAGIESFSIRSLTAVSFDNNAIAEGAIICPFTIITSNTQIGRFFHANIYSYIAHDCIIGDFVTFAPSVHCNGNIVVEDYAYIGTGVIIRHGTDDKPIVIGKGSIVGMGAVVTKSVQPFTTVIGNPAVELRKKP
jgi:sugar O-acyltransferase (sialic acid O-acetyltransferase NeuD family)